MSEKRYTMKGSTILEKQIKENAKYEFVKVNNHQVEVYEAVKIYPKHEWKWIATFNNFRRALDYFIHFYFRWSGWENNIIFSGINLSEDDKDYINHIEFQYGEINYVEI